MKTGMRPVFLCAPITHVDEEKQEIEAYALVNEVVEGGGALG
jgi:hypothetical protein